MSVFGVHGYCGYMCVYVCVCVCVCVLNQYTSYILCVCVCVHVCVCVVLAHFIFHQHHSQAHVTDTVRE